MTHAGIGSRRACEAIIEQGRVYVNGRRATLGESADPAVDEILVDGERLRLPETYDYIMLHKPRGVISDVDVSDQLRTARSLIPLAGHLYPVGRLDVTSEGLLLFTNDGDLAHRLTHPSFEHPRTYEVLVEGRPSDQTLESWRAGVYIEGQRTLPAEVSVLKVTKEGTLLSVVLREGRKRQIRKVAARLGHPVIRLLRVGMGPLQLGDLPAGNWRRLTELEVAALREVRRQRRRPRPGQGRAARKPSTGAPAARGTASGQLPRSGRSRKPVDPSAERPAGKARPASRGPAPTAGKAPPASSRPAVKPARPGGKPAGPKPAPKPGGRPGGSRKPGPKRGGGR